MSFRNIYMFMFLCLQFHVVMDDEESLHLKTSIESNYSLLVF